MVTIPIKLIGSNIEEVRIKINKYSHKRLNYMLECKYIIIIIELNDSIPMCSLWILSIFSIILGHVPGFGLLTDRFLTVTFFH